MTPSEAGGRALWLTEHPYATPDMWFGLDEGTRQWWIAKAQPITDAIQAVIAARTECEAEQRNLKTLHQLELDWGAGVFNYTTTKRNLTGRETCNHKEQAA